jgi:hypothetical protein
LDTAISGNYFPAESPPVALSVRTEDLRSFVSFSPLPSEKSEDELELFRKAFDRDAQSRELDEVASRGKAHLREAYRAGASLYAMNIPAREARILIEHCSAEIDAWLDGMSAPTQEFCHRVNMAGGLFLAICEGLLELAPTRGAQLWRALERCLRVQFEGVAGINDLYLMPFRAKANPAVLNLRSELYELKRNPTDSDYLTLTICAMTNDCEDWLRGQILADEHSDENWRRRRAILMRGFVDCPATNELQWPEGVAFGAWDMERRAATWWRNQHGLAFYWWQRFTEASTVEQAYSAWQVFLSCADRRAWVWISRFVSTAAETTPLLKLKHLQIRVNESQLKKAMSEKETRGVNSIQNCLMGWKSPRQWLDLSLVSESNSQSCGAI